MFARALVIALTLSLPQHRGFLVKSQAPHPAGTSCSQSIECAIAAGDKSGNWWALKADGTMLASSALTMSGQASPGVSPLTFNGSTQYFKSAAVAYPTGDFSFVGSAFITATPAGSGIVGKWQSGSTQWFAGFLVDKPTFIIDDATASVVVTTAAASVTTSTWVALCGRYTSASGAVSLRVAGVNTTGTTGHGITSLTLATAVGGFSDGSGDMLTGKSRGVFFTEKLLSDADCDRIAATVSP